MLKVPPVPVGILLGPVLRGQDWLFPANQTHVFQRSSLASTSEDKEHAAVQQRTHEQFPV